VSKKKAPPVKPRPRAGAAVLIALALVVLAVIPFRNVLHYGLVWDDPQLVAEVGRVAGPGGVPALFTSDFRVNNFQYLGYYRPVSTTSLWMQMRDAWRTHGADLTPEAARALHAFNLVVHIICALLVWLIIRRFVSDKWVAGMGAALFAIHPAHVEPVAFISARTDLLVTLFTLGSLLCWMDAMRTTGNRRIVAIVTGLLLALLGALSKEPALLLPAVLLAWALLLPSPETRRTRLLISAAWLIPVAITLAMRANAMPSGLGLTPQPAEFFRHGLSALVLYVKLWVLPWPLCGYYNGYEVAVRWTTIVGCALTILLGVVATRAGRKREAAAAVTLALIFIFPVLHLFPLAGAVAAERFLYLPSAGFALLTALALTGLQRTRTLRMTTRATASALVIIGLVLSARAAQSWQNNASLYAYMVKSSPHEAPPHRGLAEVYYFAGKLADAESECREAIRLDPNFADAYELLGIVNAKENNFAGAHQALDTARRLAPKQASVYSNLGILALSEGKTADALSYLRQAIALAPDFADAHHKLGSVLVLTGDIQGASAEANILDRLDPVRARDLRARIDQAAHSQSP
jgi:Flp pilus assembly protein TadD